MALREVDDACDGAGDPDALGVDSFWACDMAGLVEVDGAPGEEIGPARDAPKHGVASLLSQLDLV